MNEQAEKKQNLSQWMKETKAEVGKIVWPTWKQVINNALIVLAVVVVVGVIIWGFDFLFEWLRKVLIFA